jgi:hypothetical protein
MPVARNLDVTVNIRIIPHLKATAVRVHCRRQSIELDHGHVSSTAEPLAHSGRCWPNDAFADLELARKAKPHHVAVRLGHVEAKQRVIPTSPLVWSLWEVLHLDKRLVRSRKLPTIHPLVISFVMVRPPIAIGIRYHHHLRSSARRPRAFERARVVELDGCWPRKRSATTTDAS